MSSNKKNNIFKLLFIRVVFSWLLLFEKKKKTILLQNTKRLKRHSHSDGKVISLRRTYVENESR